MTTANVCTAAASSATNNETSSTTLPSARRRHGYDRFGLFLGPPSIIYQRWVPWILCKLQMVCIVATRTAIASLSIVDEGNSDRVE